MAVLAKFRCERKSLSPGNTEMHDVELRPVYSDDPKSENAQFWKWTPGGSIQLSTINPMAAAQFEPGKEYYVRFTNVDEE